MMNRVLARCVLFGLFGIAWSAAAISQSAEIETFAGGRRFVDAPAHDVPVFPGSTSIGTDGRLLVTNMFSSGLLRFDPVTGTASTLPLDGPYDFSYINEVMTSSDGVVYAFRDNRVVRLDIVTGDEEYVVGSGYSGNSNCVGSQYQPPDLNSNMNMAPDAFGNILFVEPLRHRVCRLTPWGDVSLVAGSGNEGFWGDGGPADSASLAWPVSVASDPAGNIYIADEGNNRIRKVSVLDGTISTIAGTGAAWGGDNGDGGPALEAIVSTPKLVTVDAAGNVFVYESSNVRVRRIDAVTGLISTFAGSGETGFSGDGGPATAAALTDVQAISVDASGNLYISDTANRRLRRVAHDTGIIDSVLGNGESAYCGDGLLPRESCLYNPEGVAVDALGNVYIADSGNGRVRKVSASTGLLTTIAGRGSWAGHAGDGGLAIDATFGAEPMGIALDTAGNLFIAGGYDYRIRRIDAASGVITTIAGTGESGFSGDGGPATLARVDLATDLVVDPAGNVYFSDSRNNRVRRIAAGTGIITTVAGSGQTSGALGDGGPAVLASLSNPNALALDQSGNLLISDAYHLRVRKVDVATGNISTIAGNGSWMMDGDGGPATAAGIGNQAQLAVDPAGNILLSAGWQLRRIDAATGIISSLAAPWGLYTPEGRTTQDPTAMALGVDNLLYIADSNEQMVFRVSGLPVASVDNTPPVVEAQVSGVAGNDGWYRSNVQISWTVTDAESAIVSSSECGAYSLTSDSASSSYTCTATSGGGTTTRSVTIRRDTTPPAVNFLAASPVATAAGWNNTDVALPFTVSDALSGVASSSSPSPVTITGEGAGLSGSLTVTDVAGNSRTVTSPAVNIDRTPPTYTLALPTVSARYGAFSNQTVQFNCNDTLSGVASCSGTLANGAPLPTNTAGNRDFQLMVTDNAGNQAGISLGYSVTALQFERFMEPLRKSPVFNGVTAGSLVPIRWRMLDGLGAVVSNPAAFQSLNVLPITCQGTGIPLNDTATGGPGLSFNPATGAFTYNWQTDAGSTGCRRVQLRLGDNSVRELVFRFQ